MDLFKSTVEDKTYQLLQNLMQIPELSEFVLVGGTNLSLEFGHRISIDLDLFTNTPLIRRKFSQESLLNYLKLSRLMKGNKPFG